MAELWQKEPPKDGDDQDYGVTFRDPDGWWRARTDWQGCTHLYSYANVPYQDGQDEDEGDHPQLVNYLHICDIDDLVARLHALKAAAQAHFIEWGAFSGARDHDHVSQEAG
jgi:hypothetical protein